MFIVQETSIILFSIVPYNVPTMRTIILIKLVLLLSFALLGKDALAQFPYDKEYPHIGYGKVPPQDHFSTVMQELAGQGKVLNFDDQGRGYLDALLAALDIDPSSQVLVFSKTSLKQRFISPQTPRSLFFNDEVYVGYVPGSSSLEIGAMDAHLGPVFFDFSQQPAADPRFEQETSRCLRCHDSYSLTGGGVPRFMLSSVLAGPDGNLVSHELSELTDTETPLEHRWGGWYVTGTSGAQLHRGNLIISDVAVLKDLQLSATSNQKNLSALVDLNLYPRATSDIVALLVLEHQIEVQNRITRLNYDSLTLLQTTPLPDQATLDALTRPLLDALFMAHETALGDVVEGSSGFTEYFQQLGLKDSEGRSLRDFDLHTHTFKYRLSYLIYSAAIDALPPLIKNHLFAQIKAVLLKQVTAPEYPHLSEVERAAITGILQETKAEVLK